MNNEKIVVVNGIEIDTEKADKILKRLIMREATNIKTKEKNDGQMVSMIKKMIEEEVQCY